MAVLVGLAGLVWVPAAGGDYFVSHDLLFWPYRLWELDRCVRDGQVFARWFPDFAWGRGLPFLNYYAPLFLYLAEGLRLAGLSILGALKVGILFILAGSAVGMYSLARQGFGREGSLLAGVAYLFGPYLLTVVYLRGGLAEALAFVWMPLCLLFLGRAVKQGGRSSILFAGVLIAALILTHNITAMLFLPLALAYGIVIGWGVRGEGKRLAICFALGLGLAAFFWVPAMVERKYVRMEEVVADRYQYQGNFASGSNLWDITGERTNPLTEDGVHLSLGGPQILLALPSLGLLGLVGRRRREVLLFWVVLAGGLFMIFPLSEPIWAGISALRYVQFPWRWMGICTLSVAYLGAAGLEAVLGKSGERVRTGELALLGGLVLLGPSLVVAWGYGAYSVTTLPLAGLTLGLGGALFLATKEGVSARKAGAGVVSLFCLGLFVLFFLGQGERGPVPMAVSPGQLTLSGWLSWERKSGFVGTTIQGEYLPREASRKPLSEPLGQRLRSAAGGGVAMERVRSWSTGLRAQLSAREETTLVYETFYFPGWRVRVDGRQVRIKVTPEGLISFRLPAGEHRVEVRFGLTRVRLGALLASYLTLAAAVFLVVKGRRRRSQ